MSSSTTPYNMINVQHIHLLYFCHVCKKQFDKRANLMRHYRTVEGNELNIIVQITRI
ncbi:hypothetical protein BDF20DRAFT_846941 [Mycotypha africana]|uniref:uncharacterized protein n=1 Tax=Mycotypha africana TaxID=64632 RepID=UPI0023007C98|nr:uncharacterized protein BDF20DRAFT_846941 [Mycotypha africana]KAI8991881.1 hypothetical protein BDF20DRAFT_846941 [Mycotypha africana]